MGKECFENVKEVNITGLSELESVKIGMNSFTMMKDLFGNNSTRSFHLKNCPVLKELKIGDYSFSDYSVCEMENVNALEVIEMGDSSDWTTNFRYASLELKSILIQSE